ncbi:MAG: AMP-binding protein [Nanoarchaeota archaeon]|nr:AMP-binding protein [Nanoarchaeota archaeon]MCG2717596.1 AMP-binding protein [Nanoarchaeota archaeon]
MPRPVKKTIAEMFSKSVRKYSKKEALICPELNIRWTYARLNKEVDETAKALLKSGIGPHDHVSVWATNIPEWVVLQFATAKIGAVLVTVNTAYKERDLEYLLKQSDSTTICLMDKFKDYSYVDILNNVVPEIKDSKCGDIKSENIPKLKTAITIGESREFPGLFSLDGLKNMEQPVELNGLVKKIIGDKKEITNKDLKKIQKKLKPDDVINIQYTSGTTGFPKGAMLSSYNMVNNALAAAECLNLKKNDRMVLPNPLFHCFGSVLGTLLAVLKGIPVVMTNIYDPTKFDKPVLEAIHNEKCTVIYGTPSHFERVLKHKDVGKYDLSSLRTGIIAGAPCPEDLMDVIESYVPEITIAYGSTELSPIITQTRINDPRDLRLGTVGKGLNIKGLHIKLMDGDKELVNTETGNYSGANTLEEIADENKIIRGELWSKGPQVMKGYYNKPKETAESIVNGWYNTEDIGTAVLVKKGRKFDVYFKITGRSNDMIITGGENIYPTEIENVLRENPDIVDVAVYGIPDEDRGEVIAISIVPKEDSELKPEDIKQFCIEQKMRKNYIPRTEFIELIDSFPMTSSGKIQKFKLQEEATKKYGREHLLKRKTA